MSVSSPSTSATSATLVPAVSPRAITVKAADGYPIQTLQYAAVGPTQGQLLIAGATAVPQNFYRRFALHAAQRGLTVTTLDYRGIGLSKPATLKGFEMRYLDWAEQDLTAVVNSLPQDERPLYLVGHSFGVHAFGLLPNHHRFTRFCTFAAGAGWHGWMPPLERVRVLAMWHLIGPVLTRWKGYLPWSLLRMGEDLPLAVYRDWKRWCQYPNYFFDDPTVPGLAERFARVTTPIRAVNALDDRWAPPRSRDAFMRGYTGTTVQAVDLDPQASGIGPIGHMGYFRPAAQPLWDQSLDWLLAKA
jgi:predicted alpha/beta hydrolase